MEGTFCGKNNIQGYLNFKILEAILNKAASILRSTDHKKTLPLSLLAIHVLLYESR